MFNNRVACLTSLDVSSADGHDLYVREDPGPFKYETTLHQNSLGERAWALQAGFVATALLDSSRLKLCWECRAGSFYEDGTKIENHSITKELQLRRLGVNDNVNVAINVMQWYEVIETYMDKSMI